MCTSVQQQWSNKYCSATEDFVGDRIVFKNMYNLNCNSSNICADHISNIAHDINIFNNAINIRYLNAYKKSKVNLFNNISNNDSGITQFQAHPPNSHVSSMARIQNNNDK